MGAVVVDAPDKGEAIETVLTEVVGAAVNVIVIAVEGVAGATDARDNVREFSFGNCGFDGATAAAGAAGTAGAAEATLADALPPVRLTGEVCRGVIDDRVGSPLEERAAAKMSKPSVGAATEPVRSREKTAEEDEEEEGQEEEEEGKADNADIGEGAADNEGASETAQKSS